MFTSSHVHPQAIEICRILQASGHQAFIVGGCVRDLHLGIAPKDWDITTSAVPTEVERIFPKTLPTGKQYGTITVCMGEGVENHFEVTTFRIEYEYLDGRRPEIYDFGQNILEDLMRRDLSINAMAYDPISGELVDPYEGAQDIDKKVLRAVGNPTERFREDGLRIMRVARFAARFGYSIEHNTWQGMCDNLDTLQKVSKERICEELRKTLMAPFASYGMSLLADSWILNTICPLLGQKTLALLQAPTEGELETRLAAYYSQFAPDLVEKDLLHLKLSNKEIKRILFLLESLQHFRAFQAQPSALAYRQFIARFKNQAPWIWGEALEQFVTLARSLGIPAQELLQPYALETVHARQNLAINGHDLMALGIPAGPQLKSLLDKCYQHVLEHPKENSREYLLNFAQEAL